MVSKDASIPGYDVFLKVLLKGLSSNHCIGWNDGLGEDKSHKINTFHFSNLLKKEKRYCIHEGRTRNKMLKSHQEKKQTKKELMEIKNMRAEMKN